MESPQYFTNYFLEFIPEIENLLLFDAQDTQSGNKKKNIIITATDFNELDVNSESGYILIIDNRFKSFHIPLSNNIIGYIFINNKELYDFAEHIPRNIKISVTLNTIYISDDVFNRLGTGEVYLFIVDDNAFDYLLINRICTFFNKQYEKTLYIVSDIDIITNYNIQTNPNISYVSTNQLNDVLVNADYVLCNKHNCYNSILAMNPTMVIGTSGLGGFVYPENLDYFEVSGYNGRPGGEINEPIPETLMEHEFFYFKNNLEKELVLQRNRDLIISKISKTKKRLKGFVEEIIYLNSRKHELRYRFAENVLYSYNHLINKWLILNDKNNKILYALDKSYKAILLEINKGCLLSELINSESDDDLKELVDVLVGEKIIVPIND